MPSRPSPLTYLYLLDHALDQEIGIAFTVTGVDRRYFCTTLGKARKESGDPRYAELIFFQPAAPHENEIFICKRTVEIDA